MPRHYQTRLAAAAVVLLAAAMGCSGPTADPGVDRLSDAAADPTPDAEPMATKAPTPDGPPTPTQPPMATKPPMAAKPMMMPAGGDYSTFKDQVESNVSPPRRIQDLVFVKPSATNPAGEPVRFADLLGKKNVLLVVMRGFSGGMICPMCTTQTSQLAAAHDAFAALDTEVLIVYPGDDSHLDEFLSAASIGEKADIADVRWDVVIDPNLAAVKLLDIEDNLAFPSTFLFDKRGRVAFAYVGADRTDRPSVSALLGKVKQLDAQ